MAVGVAIGDAIPAWLSVADGLQEYENDGFPETLSCTDEPAQTVVLAGICTTGGAFTATVTVSETAHPAGFTAVTV